MTIEAKNLTKKFRHIVALDNISLKIDEGLTLIVGSNGSGKSTLIKIILGFLRPSSGEIKVFGYNPWKEREKIIDKIGFSLDPPRIPWWMSGKEFLYAIAEMRGGDIERVLGIEKFWERKIFTYSAGMVRRISIAASLVGSPKLILLDEPFAGIDIKGKEEIRNLILDLKERGYDMIVSSHIFAPLKGVYDAIYALDAGKLIDVKEYMKWELTEAMEVQNGHHRRA